MTSYYRKFIPGCARLASPLTTLLRKDQEFKWTDTEETAFEKLKAIIASEKVLIQPDFNKPFILETDASNEGLGAALSQVMNDEERPIAFASRCLSDCEKKYSITEKETLGALWGMEQFEYYLYGREFTLRTDHKALEAFNTKGHLESFRTQRWMERLGRFNFIVEYKKGKDIPHVDALSRINIHINEVNEIAKEREIRLIHDDMLHRGARVVYEKIQDDKKKWNVRWKRLSTQ